ncbi:MAG: heme o synthase [Halobacteriaceae archaeon]
MFRGARFAWGLAVATIGVYALILAGATTTITDAATSCATWPACNGEWFALSTPALLVVWVHRVIAAVVGVLVAGIAGVAWLRAVGTRVRVAVTVATLAYPVQVAIGAYAATAGTSTLVTALHLAVGLLIFGALIVALTWTLEPADRSTPTGGTVDGPTDPITQDERPTASESPGFVATVAAYVRLMKPRLMWLLSLVAAAGMALAAGPALRVDTVVLTLAGGVLAIGASGTFNHVFERERDRAMARTADRPVVQAVVPARNAVAFGGLLTIAALVVFLQINVVAALLGVTAIGYYAVVYTLVLKPNTVQNTVVGGFAGALPALIGVAAVTGTVGITGIALASVVFLWTPAHFYNLALAYREDYERGGFPMLPVVRGKAVTRKHILLYLGATLAAAAFLGWVTALGLVFAVAATGVGALFLWAVVRLHRERSEAAAFRAFHASNAYLGTVLIAVVVDSLVV